MELSNDKKSKCHSAIVTISFDPNYILIDNTGESYINSINKKTVQINGETYINEITIPIDAISSKDLRFYKVDVSQNYTYPNNNNQSIVTITSK